MSLFQTNAPWPKAAAATKVFFLTRRFVLTAPDDDIRKVLIGLAQRHLKLAVQATPLIASRECGLGAEGYGPPNDMEAIAIRLEQLGAPLDYMVMDEPLWYGHRWNGGSAVVACHAPIPQIASEASSKMKAVRKIYPNVKIGDIEPMGVPAAQAQGWATEIAEWMDAYKRAMGERLGFFQADVVWLSPVWQGVLISVVCSARIRDIPLGMIYNGTPRDSTDSGWVDDAEAHFRYVEDVLHIAPAEAFFLSWMDHPRGMLPESKEGTLTNLVLRYANWQDRSLTRRSSSTPGASCHDTIEPIERRRTQP
jgi:hypothetical protein